MPPPTHPIPKMVASLPQVATLSTNTRYIPSTNENDEFQKKVITIDSGYYLVPAPPGCGKTDILAEKVVRALSCGVSLDDMLCLTFTNRAARGMRSRIFERLQTSEDTPEDFS